MCRRIGESGYLKQGGRFFPRDNNQDEAREQVAKGLAAIEEIFPWQRPAKEVCHYSSTKCWVFEDEFLKLGALVFGMFLSNCVFHLI